MLNLTYFNLMSDTIALWQKPGPLCKDALQKYSMSARYSPCVVQPPVMSQYVTSGRQTASSGQFTAAVVLSLSHWAVNTQQRFTQSVCCDSIFLSNLVRVSLQRRFPSDNSYSRPTMTRRWSSECPGGSGWVSSSGICLRFAYIAVIITHVSVATERG